MQVPAAGPLSTNHVLLISGLGSEYRMWWPSSPLPFLTRDLVNYSVLVLSVHIFATPCGQSAHHPPLPFQSPQPSIHRSGAAILKYGSDCMGSYSRPTFSGEKAGGTDFVDAKRLGHSGTRLSGTTIEIRSPCSVQTLHVQRSPPVALVLSPSPGRVASGFVLISGSYLFGPIMLFVLR